MLNICQRERKAEEKKIYPILSILIFLKVFSDS